MLSASEVFSSLFGEHPDNILTNKTAMHSVTLLCFFIAHLKLPPSAQLPQLHNQQLHCHPIRDLSCFHAEFRIHAGGGGLF